MHSVCRMRYNCALCKLKQTFDFRWHLRILFCFEFRNVFAAEMAQSVVIDWISLNQLNGNECFRWEYRVAQHTSYRNQHILSFNYRCKLRSWKSIRIVCPFRAAKKIYIQFQRQFTDRMIWPMELFNFKFTFRFMPMKKGTCRPVKMSPRTIFRVFRLGALSPFVWINI